MATLTPQQFAARFKAVQACPEAVDWIRTSRYPDFSAAWADCNIPQWMCWLATRLTGIEGARSVIAAVRTVARHADPKLTEPALDLAQQVLDKKSDDVERLLELGFDAAQAATHPRAANGPALMAASYTAQCVAAFRKLDRMPEGPEKQKAMIKACGHAADAVHHAIDAAPDLAHKLPALVRAQVNEAALLKVWDRLPL